jgi:hypothetical protein
MRCWRSRGHSRIRCDGDLVCAPQGHVVVSGGSAGRKRLAYDPVKAWSTASCSAADVVRREYLGMRVFFPFSSFFTSVAAAQRGCCPTDGGSLMMPSRNACPSPDSPVHLSLNWARQRSSPNSRSQLAKAFFLARSFWYATDCIRSILSGGVFQLAASAASRAKV